MGSIHVDRGQVHECDGMERNRILATVFELRANFGMQGVVDDIFATPQLFYHKVIRSQFVVEEPFTCEDDQNGDHKPPTIAEDILPLASQLFPTVAWEPQLRVGKRTSWTAFPFQMPVRSNQ